MVLLSFPALLLMPMFLVGAVLWVFGPWWGWMPFNSLFALVTIVTLLAGPSRIRYTTPTAAQSTSSTFSLTLLLAIAISVGLLFQGRYWELILCATSYSSSLLSCGLSCGRSGPYEHDAQPLSLADAPQAARGPLFTLGVMDKYDARLQHITERTLTAKFSFWSAMLTAHTVLLSVAVALLATDTATERWAFKLIGYMAIICMFLLLLNFALAKSQYEVIGRRLAAAEEDLSEAARARDLRLANLRWYLTHACEVGSMLGLAAQGAVLGWVLITT